MGPDLVACEYQRHRPACASAQSDQRHCFTLYAKVLYLNLLHAKFQDPTSLSKQVGVLLRRKSRRQIFSRMGHITVDSEIFCQNFIFAKIVERHIFATLKIRD